MVHRLIVQYGQPTDPAAFDRHYREVHIGLARDLPGLIGFTIGHPRSLDPRTPAPYLVAELDFPSADVMAAGLGSDAGLATAADVETFATGGVTMASYDVDDVGRAG
jgi:uncharacterized protein (TIGR02118 family)